MMLVALTRSAVYLAMSAWSFTVPLLLTAAMMASPSARMPGNAFWRNGDARIQLVDEVSV